MQEVDVGETPALYFTLNVCVPQRYYVVVSRGAGVGEGNQTIELRTY